MNEEELIGKFKEHDYDWNATGNDYCVKQYVKAVEDYIKQNNLYTKEDVVKLCSKAYDDGFTCGHYDEQEKTAEAWVEKNVK